MLLESNILTENFKFILELVLDVSFFPHKNRFFKIGGSILNGNSGGAPGGQDVPSSSKFSMLKMYYTTFD